MMWRKGGERMKIKDCKECVAFLASQDGDKIVNAVADLVDDHGKPLGLDLVAAYMTGYHRRGHIKLSVF